MNVQDFLLPDLGEGLTEGTIVAWLVGVGDDVAIDQPVAEVETAKAVVELPCPFAGIVEALHVEAGDELEVGGRLMSVRMATASSPTDESAAAEDERPLVGYGAGGTTPLRNRSRSGGSPAAEPATATVDDPVAAPRCKPFVRKLAKELRVDLWAVSATGPNGAVTEADVRAAAAAAETESAPPEPTSAAPNGLTAVPTSSPVAASERDRRRSGLEGVRRRVADKMVQSRREIPHATTWVDFDATELLALRAELQAAFEDIKISPFAILLRACTAALERFPVLNCTFDGTTNEIVRHDAIHLGVATETDRGLLVPVIRDAGGRSIKGLARELNELAEKARSGSLGPAELAGGTFTVSNYGSFGADSGEAIINHPQVAILGVGRIAARPWAVGDEVRIRQTCQLSMSFDHRACDGGEPARFLRLMASYLESHTAPMAHL